MKGIFLDEVLVSIANQVDEFSYLLCSTLRLSKSLYRQLLQRIEDRRLHPLSSAVYSVEILDGLMY